MSEEVRRCVFETSEDATPKVENNGTYEAYRTRFETARYNHQEAVPNLSIAFSNQSDDFKHPNLKILNPRALVPKPLAAALKA